MVIVEPTIALAIAGATVKEPRVVATFTPDAVMAATSVGAVVTADATAARVMVWLRAILATSLFAAIVVAATTPLMTFVAKFGDWVRMEETTSATTLGAATGSARVITKAEITLATCCV